VPANRIGSEEWSVPQLKILQECITLVVFTVVAYALFGTSLKWNHLVSYAFIVGAVCSSLFDSNLRGSLPLQTLPCGDLRSRARIARLSLSRTPVAPRRHRPSL
jgi:hypothetical protein